MHSSISRQKEFSILFLRVMTAGKYFVISVLSLVGFFVCVRASADTPKSPFPYDYTFNVIEKSELEATAYGYTVIQNGNRIGLANRDYKQGHCMALDKKFEVTKGIMHTELKRRSDNWIIVRLFTDGSLDRYGYHYTIECHLPAYGPIFLKQQLKGIVDLEII